MSTTLATIKRKTDLNVAALSLVANQWGFAQAERRLVVMHPNGIDTTQFLSSYELSKQTSTFGSENIGTGPISGVAPSGGSVGDSGTVYTMLQGVYDSAVVLQPSTTARNVIQAADTTIDTLTVKQMAAQTGFLQVWRLSSGTASVWVDPTYGSYGALGAMQVNAYAVSVVGAVDVGTNVTAGGTIKAGGTSAINPGYVVQPSSGDAVIVFDRLASSATNKAWSLSANGTTFEGQARSDDYSTAANWLTVTRSGVSISSIQLSASAIALAGNTSVTGAFDVSSTIRSTGSASPASGIGVEIDYGGVANTGRIFAYDRGGSAYKAMRIGPNFDIAVAGDIAINTNKFTVAAATGNVATAGTVSIAVDLDFSAATGTGGVNKIGRSATNGLVIRGSSGSSYDLMLVNASGTTLLQAPHGTTSVEMPGSAGLNISGGNLTVESSNSGSIVISKLSNSSNTASSSARQDIVVAGATADDPFLRLTVTGVTSWAAGIDNSVTGDPFVLAASGTLGTSNVLSVTTAGAFTMTGTLALSSDLAINTNKFTVAGSTGNTLAAGTLDVTGNFNVNTNKFSVVASSGDTTVAGYLTVGTSSATRGVSGVRSLYFSIDTGNVSSTDAFTWQHDNGAVGGGTVLMTLSENGGLNLAASGFFSMTGQSGTPSGMPGFAIWAETAGGHWMIKSPGGGTGTLW